jgi:hypothetical protein
MNPNATETPREGASILAIFALSSVSAFITAVILIAAA